MKFMEPLATSNKLIDLILCHLNMGKHQIRLAGPSAMLPCFKDVLRAVDGSQPAEAQAQLAGVA